MPQIRPIGVSGSIPSVNQLALGDIAINTYDGKAYIKKAVGNTQTILEIGTGGGGSSISASYASTASYAFFAVTASFAQNFNPSATASYAVTASYALFALTSSYTNFSLSASYALSSSHSNTAVTSISSSYALSASYSNIAGSSISSSYALSSSVAVTASYVLNAVSSSFASTASFVVLAQTASYVTLAQTASYVLNAISASFASTASFVRNAQTASYVLNAVSSSFSSTASYVNPLTQSVLISGSVITTGSTGIYGNLAVNNATLVDFNTSVLSINAPLFQVPSFGLAYSPSANVRVVMYDAVSNALFVTASAPSSPIITNFIATGSITASVQIGPGAAVPYFFLVQSGSVEMLKINAERVVVLEARIDIPTPVTGGLYYSASGDFFFGM